MFRKLSVVFVVLALLLWAALPACAQGDEPTIREQINDLLNQLLVLVAGLLALALPYVIQGARLWFQKRWEAFMARQPENVRKAIEDAALIATRFVEQMNLSEQLQNYTAQEMRNLALNAGVGWLEAQGYEVTAATRAAIEAAIENVILGGQHKKEAAMREAGTLEVALPAGAGRSGSAEALPFGG